MSPKRVKAPKEPPSNPRLVVCHTYIDDGAMLTFQTFEGDEDAVLTLYVEGQESIPIPMLREVAEQLAHGIYVALEENPV